MKKSEIIAVAAAIVLIAGGIIWRVAERKGEEKGASAQAAALQTASIESALIHPIVTTKTKEVSIGNTMTASGDMDGDGVPDTAAVLTESGTGSAKFVSVVLFRNASGTPAYAGGMFIGDRDEVKSLEIKDEVLTVNYLGQRPTDYVNKPTEPKTLRLKIANGSLVNF